MDLKYLRYFLAVAEELHFTRAAARLNMSQPPLSQIISRLENDLGFKLFERTKRKVTLTEAGNILLHEGRAILSRAEFAVQHANRAARGHTGHLKVAFIPWTDFTHVFSNVFRTYDDRFPNVTVDFHSMPAPAAIAALGEARIDVAFLAISALTEPPRGFNHELVLSEPIEVALPDRHPLAKKRTITLKSLATEPQIVVAHDRHESFFQLAELLFQRAGVRMQARHVIDHPQTTLALVAAGAGVSLVPASFENVPRRGVVYRPITPTVRVNLIAAWKPENRSTVLHTFLDTLRDVVQKKVNTDRRTSKSRYPSQKNSASSRAAPR